MTAAHVHGLMADLLAFRKAMRPSVIATATMRALRGTLTITLPHDSKDDLGAARDFIAAGVGVSPELAKRTRAPSRQKLSGRSVKGLRLARSSSKQELAHS